VELADRNLRSGDVEHLRRLIDADHLMAELCEMCGMPSGAAGRVDGDARLEAAQDLANDRLFVVDEGVARLGVERRPSAIDVARRDGSRGDAVAELVGSVEERPDLGEAGLGELPVVLAGERAAARRPRGRAGTRVDVGRPRAQRRDTRVCPPPGL
jgi:hypothetical protein